MYGRVRARVATRPNYTQTRTRVSTRILLYVVLDEGHTPRRRTEKYFVFIVFLVIVFFFGSIVAIGGS